MDPRPTHRKLSMSIQLSSGDDYKGGDLTFGEDIINAQVLPKQTFYVKRRSVVVFPSFVKHCVTSSVTKEKDTRWWRGWKVRSSDEEAKEKATPRMEAGMAGFSSIPMPITLVTRSGFRRKKRKTMIPVKITDEMFLKARQKNSEMGLLRNSIIKGNGSIAGFLGEQIVLEVLGGEWVNTYEYDIVLENGLKVEGEDQADYGHAKAGLLLFDIQL